MADPILFGRKAVAQISATVKQVGATIRNPEPAPRARWQRSGRSKQAVVLDSPLGVAQTAFVPSSAMATVLEWDGTRYNETDEQVEVFNHSESLAFAINTFGFSELIDDHECFMGDCKAMKNRAS